MHFWLRLLRALGFQAPVNKTYYLEERMTEALQNLVDEAQREDDKSSANRIKGGALRQMSHQDLLERWYTLSPREQQVVVMVCDNLTTGEIAAALVISENTVKVHVRKALAKFGVHSRTELRLLFYDYFFDSRSNG